MDTITNIEDLKKIYKRRVPKMFYDYAESGSWTEQTFRDNMMILKNYGFASVLRLT